MNTKSNIQLSCLRATELIEKRKIVPLTVSEKFKLFIHTKMCKVCNNYIKESDLMDKAIEVLHERTEDEHLQTNALEKRILHNLDSEK